MAKRDVNIPGVVVEVLRLCAVVFGAGVGYFIAQVPNHPDHPRHPNHPGHLGVRIGPFEALGTGIILGAADGRMVFARPEPGWQS
jgi:hypothetical protein